LKNLRSDVRGLQKLRERAEVAPDQTWAEFEERVFFLQGWGYLDEDRGFNAGALALQHVQINEILVVEAFLQGIFDDLDADTLYGVCCGMCTELPRSARTRLPRKDRGLIKQLERLKDSDIVVDAERLTGQRTQWDGQLIPFGRAWARGASLLELMEMVDANTDISGDLVGAFRRARDLVGQLRSLYSHDPQRASELDELSKKVRRDEVEVVG
jgi:superfamily II RNA helicase